jgi:hypothetical protein
VGGSLQPDGLWGRNIYRGETDKTEKPMGVVLEVTKEFNQEKKQLSVNLAHCGHFALIQ